MYLSLAYVFVLFAFLACGQNRKLENSHCIVKNKPLGELLYGLEDCYNQGKGNGKKFEVEFFNNPYELDSSYHLVVMISGYIIYQGKFDKYVDAIVSEELIEKHCSLRVVLGKEDKSYIFNTDELAFLDKEDDYIQIVFIPKENDWFTFYFSFSKRGKYLE